MNTKKILTVGFLILCMVLLAGLSKAYLDGKFHSVETLQQYVRGFGAFAPVILVALQALQVVVPVLPGFLGCAAGAVLFGSAGGFHGVGNAVPNTFLPVFLLIFPHYR